MDFAHSARSQSLIARLQRFMRDEVVPAEARYASQLSGSGDWRQWRQPAVMEALKAKARAAGLWNLFLPDAGTRRGPEQRRLRAARRAMGRSFMAPEVFNCNAPDTGNMEVLCRYGSTEQKERWLEPLLAGRSARRSA